MPGAPPLNDWVLLLDADTSLASAVAPHTPAEALPVCPAPSRWLDPGAWQPSDDLGGPGWLGMLVLDGFVVRQVDVVGRPATELLGPGDLLRPWEPDRTTCPARCPTAGAASRRLPSRASAASRCGPWS